MKPCSFGNLAAFVGGPCADGLWRENLPEVVSPIQGPVFWGHLTLKPYFGSLERVTKAWQRPNQLVGWFRQHSTSNRNHQTLCEACLCSIVGCR